LFLAFFFLPEPYQNVPDLYRRGLLYG